MAWTQGPPTPTPGTAVSDRFRLPKPRLPRGASFAEDVAAGLRASTRSGCPRSICTIPLDRRSSMRSCICRSDYLSNAETEILLESGREIVRLLDAPDRLSRVRKRQRS